MVGWNGSSCLKTLQDGNAVSTCEGPVIHPLERCIMGSGEQLQKKDKAAAMVAMTEEDLVRLRAIEVDRDTQDALAFVRERILPQVQRQENSRMKGFLDGGSGSLR